MDETTKGIIERIAIQFPKPTRIPSGQVCSVFYDCFQLTPNDLARLAAHAVGHLDHDAFDVAVGRAYSGILFAASVAGGRKVAILQKDGRFFGPDLKGQRVVVVDDVVHSGRQLQDAAERVQAEGGRVVGFACLIDRSGGTFGNSDGADAASGLGAPLWSAFQTEME
jgi:orotate phosphoribosyltransferase